MKINNLWFVSYRSKSRIVVDFLQCKCISVSLGHKKKKEKKSKNHGKNFSGWLESERTGGNLAPFGKPCCEKSWFKYQFVPSPPRSQDGHTSRPNDRTQCAHSHNAVKPSWQTLTPPPTPKKKERRKTHTKKRHFVALFMWTFRPPSSLDLTTHLVWEMPIWIHIILNMASDISKTLYLMNLVVACISFYDMTLSAICFCTVFATLVSVL